MQVRTVFARVILVIAEYASPERAKEVLNDMFQKYAAGEKAYIMPEE